VDERLRLALVSCRCLYSPSFREPSFSETVGGQKERARGIALSPSPISPGPPRAMVRVPRDTRTGRDRVKAGRNHQHTLPRVRLKRCALPWSRG
jgi:hypothetical protein